MKVWREGLDVMSSFLFGLVALAFVVSGVPISIDSNETIVVEEKVDDPPRHSPGLGFLCRILQIEAHHVGPAEVRVQISEDRAVDLQEVRSMNGKFRFRQDFDSDSSPYVGLFATGAINDGLRAELGLDYQIGILVERPTSGENEFSSIATRPELMSDGFHRFEIGVDFEQSPWMLSSGGLEMSLPTFRPKSCDNPRLGGGFDESRNFSGEITMELTTEIQRRNGPMQFTRSVARWILFPGLGLVGFRFFLVLSSRSGDSEA